MIVLLLQLLASAAAALALACLPGWAVTRLFELQLRLPVTALLPAAFALGLGTWTVLLALGLALGVAVQWTLCAHLVATAVLWLLVWRREGSRFGALAHPRRDTASTGVGRWTIAVIAIATVAAAGLRTRLAFDSLFHLGIVRRMAELGSPTFENLDRIVGSGVNPAYALPSWQGLLAATSALTGLDPAIVLEGAAIVAVLLAASCAAALGRVVTGTGAGEVTGAAAYTWLRVAFPRRELEGDGVAYAPIPGNLALDVLLPLILVTAIVILRSRRRTPRDGGLVALLGACAALVVVLHANYAVYVAIIGAGTALWLLACGPWSRRVAARLGLVAASIAVPGLVVLAALLPLLMLLDHFGAPVEARIDYHLASLLGTDVIRPGHLYDWFAAPGLLGILVLPWAAWISRGAARAVVAGGSIALLAVALVPGGLDLLGLSGSLTLGLRLPRPLGVLLVAAAAIAVPDLVARVHGIRHRRIASAVALLALVGLVALYGYPLARREPPQYGWDWPTLVSAAGLVAVLVGALVQRRRGRAGSPDALLDDGTRARTAALAPGTVAVALLLLAACMLPSGLMSMRRGAWQSRELVASYRADDLRCYDGVQAALRRIPAGDVLLADPVTGYGAQALAPAYLVGDFKVWNGATDEARLERRIALLDRTFQTARAETAGYGLARLSKDYGARWLLVASGEVQPPVGSELYPYDAVGLRRLLESGETGARLVASGDGRMPKDATDEERAECDLSLWELDGRERSLEIETDDGHDLLTNDSTTGKGDHG